jgi:hypothetical protein
VFEVSLPEDARSTPYGAAVVPFDGVNPPAVPLPLAVIV